MLLFLMSVNAPSMWDEMVTGAAAAAAAGWCAGATGLPGGTDAEVEEADAGGGLRFLAVLSPFTAAPDLTPRIRSPLVIKPPLALPTT